MPRKIPTGHPVLEAKSRGKGGQQRRPDLAAIRALVEERAPSGSARPAARPDPSALARLKAQAAERAGQR